MTPEKVLVSCAVLLAGSSALLGCGGIVAGDGSVDGGSTGREASSDSGGTGSSSGATSGPGSTPVPGGPSPPCIAGGACQPGAACATTSAPGPGMCSLSCTCDATYTFQCEVDCLDGSTPTGCAQGAACSPGSSCGEGSTGSGACATSCTCDGTGHLACVRSCGGDAACAQAVSCPIGDRWDATQCTCVPGGPTCCPRGWEMYPCTEGEGVAGYNCHDPEVACASSTTCGGGCDVEVSGACPVCDPVPCPPGQTFDPTACQCAAAPCTSVSDCLPQGCPLCADGGVACVLASCIDGRCQTTRCD